ncbi:alcohol dehydrogenase catalytic domain-containing protein [Ruminococcaceae bacterium OttesenSCG-928-A16]|nr:alcohol dehydrogenase catalytic domain-containing protein [Ruminococcaceae bacterium OttesenSCG-928-A16]
MKALFFDKTPVYTTSYAKPVPAPNQSLVKILMAAICNTDREVMKGYKPGFTGILGHEFVGIVEESSDTALVGKRVVGELNAGCKTCLYCTTGREHHCTTRKVLGMDGKDGCFAEYMTIATDLLHIVPNDLPTEQAIFCEPLAAALEVVEQSHLRPSQEVALVGDGRLAYMIGQVIALQGTPLTVFGHSTQKLAMFAPFAKTSLQPTGSFEVVVEASGSPSGLETAIALTRSMGLLVLKSTYAGLTPLNTSELVVREITLRGSRCGPFVPALNLLQRGQITLPPIELFPLQEYEQAFASRAFKVGFKF